MCRVTHRRQSMERSSLFPHSKVSCQLSVVSCLPLIIIFEIATWQIHLTRRTLLWVHIFLFWTKLILKFEFIGSIRSTCAKLSINPRVVNVYLKRPSWLSCDHISLSIFNFASRMYLQILQVAFLVWRFKMFCGETGLSLASYPTSVAASDRAVWSSNDGCTGST